MIRRAFIENQVLILYRKIPKIAFPLDVQSIVRHIPNCRYMSYQQFADLNKCSPRDVIQLCESESGCTHYDITRNRYLILCNHQGTGGHVTGRERWTCGHEIGHVVCNHFMSATYDKMAEEGTLKNVDPVYEREADYFASTLLAPFPLYNMFNIKSAIDVQDVFGLSTEASLYRYQQYIRWVDNHQKTRWENDMLRNYMGKK